MKNLIQDFQILPTPCSSVYERYQMVEHSLDIKIIGRHRIAIFTEEMAYTEDA